MPADYSVRRGNRGDAPQDRTADAVGSRRQPMAILIREAQPTATNLAAQEPVLFDQIRNSFPVAVVQPAGPHPKHHLATP